MLLQKCFSQQDKDHMTCNTKNKKLFECGCCNATDFRNCKVGYFKDVFHVHRNHTSKPLNSHINLTEIFDSLSDYYDDFEYEFEEYDSTIGDVGSKEANITITDLEHAFNECKEREILPLFCDVSRFDNETTFCECFRNFDNEIVPQTYYKTKGLWNEHICDVTPEMHTIMKLEESMHKIIIFNVVLVCLFFMLILFIYIIKKFKPSRSTNSFLDPINLVRFSNAE